MGYWPIVQGTDKSAENSTASVVLSSEVGKRLQVVEAVIGYYRVPNIDSELTVTSNGVTLFQAPITQSGIAPIKLTGLTSSPSQDLTFSLSAGGNEVVGVINVTAEQI